MSRRLRSVLAWCACVALAPVAYLHGRIFAAHSSWDALVYAKAITSFSNGGTPYIMLGGFYFVYPPVMPLTGRLLAWLLTPHVGWILFLLTNMVSVAALPFIIARFYLQRLVIGEAYALFLIAPRFLFEPVFFGGNIAAPCYVAAILAAIPGLKRGRWRWFYLTVIVISNIKITFLVLLLIPFFVGIRQLLPCVAMTIATFGAYLLQKLCVPNLYRQFQNELARQTFFGRDYGISAFGVAGNTIKRLNITGYSIPWVTQILFVTAIVSVLWFLRSHVNLKDERFLALVLVTVVLVNPRIIVYDAFLAVIPGYYLMLSNVRRPLTWLLTAFAISGYFIGHGDMGYLSSLIAAFIVGVVDLRSEKRLGTVIPTRVIHEAG